MTPRNAVLGIGTAPFLANYGIGTGPSAGDDILRAAIDGGVRYLDTAAAYGDAERAVGRALRDGVRVCTKIAGDATIDQVRASVERLGSVPHTILIHSAGRGQLVSAPAVATLQHAREIGLAKRIGASTYGVGAAALAIEQPWCDVVQIEFSVLNQPVLPALKRRRENQEIVARSVLCKGLLTRRRTSMPHVAATVADTLRALERYAGELNRSLEELAIRFALDAPGIDVVLVGVTTHAELQTALLAAASPPLTEAQWKALAAFDRSDADAAHPERWNNIS